MFRLCAVSDLCKEAITEAKKITTGDTVSRGAGWPRSHIPALPCHHPRRSKPTHDVRGAALPPFFSLPHIMRSVEPLLPVANYSSPSHYSAPPSITELQLLIIIYFTPRDPAKTGGPPLASAITGLRFPGSGF